MRRLGSNPKQKPLSWGRTAPRPPQFSPSGLGFVCFCDSSGEWDWYERVPLSPRSKEHPDGEAALPPGQNGTGPVPGAATERQLSGGRQECQECGARNASGCVPPAPSSPEGGTGYSRARGSPAPPPDGKASGRGSAPAWGGPSRRGNRGRPCWGRQSVWVPQACVEDLLCAKQSFPQSHRHGRLCLTGQTVEAQRGRATCPRAPAGKGQSQARSRPARLQCPSTPLGSTWEVCV